MRFKPLPSKTWKDRSLVGRKSKFGVKVLFRCAAPHWYPNKNSYYACRCTRCEYEFRANASTIRAGTTTCPMCWRPS